VAPDTSCRAVQDADERLERAHAHWEVLAAAPEASAQRDRAKAAAMIEVNRVLVHELWQLADRRPALGVAEALLKAGLERSEDVPDAADSAFGGRFSTGADDVQAESGALSSVPARDSRPTSAASLAQGIAPA
jgi:hypothetical protein